MPSMKLTRNEFVELYGGLLAVGRLSGSRFVYVVAKNLSLLKDEISAIRAASKPLEDYEKYDQERLAIAESYADKDKEGKPVRVMESSGNLERERYVISDRKSFDREIEELKVTHKEAIENRKKQEKEVEEMLKETIELFLLGLSKEDLPENITASQLTAIFPLLMDDEKVE